jgi:DNA-binding MarR family transcriptional regulator
MAAQVPQPHLDAWRGMLNAHSAVIARVEQALADAGLPPLSWYDVLWALRRAPRRRLRMSALAASLTISRGGLTKLADRLEQAGLIRREACASDRRGFDAVLTPEGEKTLRRMWPVYARALNEWFVNALDEDQADSLAGTLDRVAERASSDLERAPA